MMRCPTALCWIDAPLQLAAAVYIHEEETNALIVNKDDGAIAGHGVRHGNFGRPNSMTIINEGTIKAGEEEPVTSPTLPTAVAADQRGAAIFTWGGRARKARSAMNRARSPTANLHRQLRDIEGDIW